MFDSKHVVVVIVLLVCGALACSVRAAEIEWKPVSSTGPFVVVGNEMFIPEGGVQVTLEFYISGWAPELLRAYQVTVDSPDYPGGTGMLEPACEPDTGIPAPGNCAFIDKGRTDYVFFGAQLPINAVDTSTLQYRWGAPLFYYEDAVPDPGEPRYGGTLIVEVASSASGTLTVGFSTRYEQETFLANPMVPIPELIVPLTLTPAHITIGAAPVRMVPTISAWGGVVLALVLLTGAKVYFGRHRATPE